MFRRVKTVRVCYMNVKESYHRTCSFGSCSVKSIKSFPVISGNSTLLCNPPTPAEGDLETADHTFFPELLKFPSLSFSSLCYCTDLCWTVTSWKQFMALGIVLL